MLKLIECYLGVQWDLVGRFITPITHVVTLLIPIINLLLSPPDLPGCNTYVERTICIHRCARIYICIYIYVHIQIQVWRACILCNCNLACVTCIHLHIYIYTFCILKGNVIWVAQVYTIR